MHAGMKPVEKERADAVVMEESEIGQGTQIFNRDTSLCPPSSSEACIYRPSEIRTPLKLKGTHHLHIPSSANTWARLELNLHNIQPVVVSESK